MRAGFGHRPDRLVPQLDARPRRRVVVQVEIRPADGRRLDGDDDTVGTGKHGIGNVAQRDDAWSLENGGSHSTHAIAETRDYTDRGQIPGPMTSSDAHGPLFAAFDHD